MIDSLSKNEPIHFKKDISGFENFNIYLTYYLYKIEIDIKREEDASNNLCMNKLKRLKYKLEKEIKYNNNRIEMLK
jgi:hypothetical protein